MKLPAGITTISGQSEQSLMIASVTGVGVGAGAVDTGRFAGACATHGVMTATSKQALSSGVTDK